MGSGQADKVALMSGDSTAVRIVPYQIARQDHREAFASLNFAWIERFFEVEEPDRRQLLNPEGILADGGAILMAETNAASTAGTPEILGTCALIAEPDESFELAKMAVSEAARGRGIGRMLCEAAIAEARRRGALRVELLSSRRLLPALSLYRSLGFVEAPMPETEYTRADIRMVLELRG